MLCFPLRCAARWTPRVSRLHELSRQSRTVNFPFQLSQRQLSIPVQTKVSSNIPSCLHRRYVSLPLSGSPRSTWTSPQFTRVQLSFRHPLSAVPRRRLRLEHRKNFIRSFARLAPLPPKPAPLEEAAAEPTPPRSVAVWLFVVSGMVFLMVVVGGLTRLTKSGLSMTDWKFTGERPPLSRAEWEAEFERYKAFPEYQKGPRDMTLSEFKFIFGMEWGHRMLGRAIGLAFLGPAVYFAARRQLPGWNLKFRIVGIFGLICGQGIVGWWMVKSGLEPPPQHRPARVSPYRLAAHLLSAFVIYGSLLTTAMRCWSPPPVLPLLPGLQLCLTLLTPLLALTVTSGVFVAGNQAGLIYNEFPKMGGKWVPDDIIDRSMGRIQNVFENSTLVQFNHRWLALTTGWLSLLVWLKTRRGGMHPQIRLAGSALGGAAAVQAGALTVFSIALWLRYLTSRAGVSL